MIWKWTHRRRALTAALGLLAIACAVSAPNGFLVRSCYALQAGEPATAPSAANRRIGAIKSINGTAIVLAPDSGPDVNVAVGSATRILRIAPGEKDLKNATTIQLQDLQVGDRILVGGKPSDDNLSLAASSIVVMKRSDLEARHQQDLQDWQKRGVDGLATAVDPAAGTITISVRGKSVVVHASNQTVIRRYASDSVKFDDAKPSAIAEIHPGDQVRARGDRNLDGSEVTADEIVSGSFRNIAGTVNSVDAVASTLNVYDLLSKKNTTVKITQDSQLHQLPPEVAEQFAARLRRTAQAAAGGAATGSNSVPAAPTARPGASDATASAPNGGQRRGAPDLQQFLNHLPAASLTDLHKGDAVIILSTEGTGGVGTIITLLTGVESILRAAPNASGASILTPWSLSAPSGDAGGP